MQNETDVLDLIPQNYLPNHAEGTRCWRFPMRHNGRSEREMGRRRNETDLEKSGSGSLVNTTCKSNSTIFEVIPFHGSVFFLSDRPIVHEIRDKPLNWTHEWETRSGPERRSLGGQMFWLPDWPNNSFDSSDWLVSFLEEQAFPGYQFCVWLAR